MLQVDEPPLSVRSLSRVDSFAPLHLLTAKVTVPEPIRHYLYRRSLMQRLDSVADHRITALQAPAGFGKTTTLADFSRRKREQGLLVGWVSVDEDDTPSVLGRYIAYALERAGLDLSVLNDQDGWNSTPFMHQMGVLAGAMERHETPCMLVFDEVDRLPRRTLALLDFLAFCGTSAGALVGGFYAAGKLDFLEDWVRNLTFGRMLSYVRWVVDGALANPLPISACRALGAQLVIGVSLFGSRKGGRASASRIELPEQVVEARAEKACLGRQA